jgi:hypothetical protein
MLKIQRVRQQFRKSISKSPLIAGNHHFFQCFIPVNAVDCVKGTERGQVTTGYPLL